MSLLDTIRKDMFEARKNGDVNKANILGIAISDINNFQLTNPKDLTDEDVVSQLRKEEKKLKDAFDQYTQNGREDLAKIEKEQLDAIQSYLPQLMSEEDVEKFVREEIKGMGEVSMKDIGKVMGPIMGKLKGKADGNVVNSVVRKVLGA